MNGGFQFATTLRHCAINMREALPLRIKHQAEFLNSEYYSTCESFLDAVESRDMSNKEKIEEIEYLDNRIDWIYDELIKTCEPIWSEQKGLVLLEMGWSL
jgi:hypothetical protein